MQSGQTRSGDGSTPSRPKFGRISMNTKAEVQPTVAIPFDHARVDRLMDEAGLDVCSSPRSTTSSICSAAIASSSSRPWMRSATVAICPIVIYEKGRPEHAAYIGNSMEGDEHQNNPFWTPSLHTETWGTLDAARLAVEHLKKARPGRCADRHRARLPAGRCLRRAAQRALPMPALADATSMLERMRAIKTPEETRQAAHRVRADHRFHAGRSCASAARARPRARSSRR